jgi:hypothetical protein
MEQMMERLLAKMDSIQQETKAWREEMREFHEMIASRERMVAYQQELQANPEEKIGAIAKHQEVTREEKMGTGVPIWGPTSGRKAPRTAEETDPG